MDVVIRSFKGGPLAGHRRQFEIYTREEADERGIRYRDWRFSRAGDWVVSDDGFVMQVASVSMMRTRHGDKSRIRAVAYRMTGGAVIVQAKRVYEAQFLYGTFRELVSKGKKPAWVRGKARSWEDDWFSKPNVKASMNLFVRLWVMRQGVLRNKDWVAIAKVAAPKDAKPWLRANWIKSRPEIMGRYMSMLSEELRNLGLTPEKLAKWTDATFKMAEETGNVKEMRGVLEFTLKALSVDFKDPGDSDRDRHEVETDWTSESHRVGAAILPLELPAYDEGVEAERDEAAGDDEE